MNRRKPINTQQARARLTRVAAIILLIICACPINAQTQASPTPSPAPQVETPPPAGDLSTRASVAACTEREQDPLGSMAIDEMQARPSLPLLHEDVTAGAQRAERLLPLARTLTAAALR